jgi:hypothetical protein
MILGDHTYGFSKSDAEDLVNSLQMRSVEHPMRVPRDDGGNGGVIEYTIISLTTKETGPYTGLKAASALIHGAPCGRGNLIGTTVEVIDHSGGLFDASGSMAGYTGWASEMVFLSLDAEDECDTKTPCHWTAINRVCEPDTGVYAEPCGDDEEEEPEEPEPEEPGDPEEPLEELE